MPFDDDLESELQRKVVKMDYFMPAYFSDGKKSMIHQHLNYLQINDYFTDVADLIQKILRLNPNERFTITQIRHHPWLINANHISVTNKPLLISSNQNQKLHEQHTADSLLNSGFDKLVVKEMRLNHFGMLGTLWTMLLLKSNHSVNVTSEEVLLPKTTCATQIEREQEDGWIDSLKSWFVSKPTNINNRIKSRHMIKLILNDKRLPGAVQQHQFMMKTMVAPPIINEGNIVIDISSCEKKHPALKPTVLPLTPIYPTTPTKEDDELIVNTSSTCSSTADDDYDDGHTSMVSSPATSVAEDEEEDEEKQKGKEENGYKKNACKADFTEPDANYNMTAFHRVSPMVKQMSLIPFLISIHLTSIF